MTSTKPIILSADSTCDLGDELKRQLDVHYYPFHIVWHGQDYQDNVDITTRELFDGYYADGSLPKTSAINEQEYLDYFGPFVADGFEVIHFNLGAAISSAHGNALRAARSLEGVHVVDSKNLSTGIALQLIYARERIDAGMDAASIVEEIEGMQSRVRSSFVLDTLDFMAAGGRCPSIAAHLSKKLSFHPQIAVDNASGSMSVCKLYRGSLKRALEKYVSDTLKAHPDIVKDHVFVTYTGDPLNAARVVDMLRAADDFGEIHVTEASCTIGSHCGPNTLGVLFVTEN